MKKKKVKLLISLLCEEIVKCLEKKKEKSNVINHIFILFIFNQTFDRLLLKNKNN
jgi:hypothetical protein